MKKYFSILLGLILLSYIATPIFAEGATTSDSANTSSGNYTLQTEINDNTTKAVNKYFDLTITRGLQSPLGKSILYTITIVPHLDSSKTQITWDSASSIKITPWHDEYVSMTAEKEYSYKAVVKPTVSGTYSITVTVVSWQYDTNYTNSVSDSLELSSSLVSLPITPEYTISVVIEVLVILGICGAAIYFGVKYAKKGLKNARKWLTPPM